MPWLLILWRRTWRVRYLGLLLRKIGLRSNAQMQHIYFNPSELNRTRRNVFFLHPTQAYSSTQTFSSPCRGPSRPTRPYGRFLSTVITHAVLLVHTDVFSPLLQSIQANPSTQKKPTQAYQSTLHPTKGSLLSPDGHLDISSLLTFPAISELTPVHKDIWRLLEFPVHSEFT